MISVWTLSTFCISVDVKLALIFNAIFVYLFQLQTAFSLSWAGVGWGGGGGGGGLGRGLLGIPMNLYTTAS